MLFFVILSQLCLCLKSALSRQSWINDLTRVLIVQPLALLTSICQRWLHSRFLYCKFHQKDISNVYIDLVLYFSNVKHSWVILLLPAFDILYFQTASEACHQYLHLRLTSFWLTAWSLDTYNRKIMKTKIVYIFMGRERDMIIKYSFYKTITTQYFQDPKVVDRAIVLSKTK